MVGFPAARKGDSVTHDLLVPSGLIGAPLTGPCPGLGVVMIENLPAAHVDCSVICSGVLVSGQAHIDEGTGADAVQAAEADDQGSYEIKLLAGAGLGVSVWGIFGVKKEEMLFSVTNVDTGAWAVYRLSADSAGAGLGLPVTGDAKWGGEPVRFRAPAHFGVRDFDGLATITARTTLPEAPEPGKRPEPTLGPPSVVNVTIKTFKGHELDFPDIDLGDGVSFGTLVEASGGTAVFSALPLIGGEGTPGAEEDDVPPPVVPIVTVSPVVLGSDSVRIHDRPAARWAPSGDMTECGAQLGDPKLTPTRTVLIGGLPVPGSVP